LEATGVFDRFGNHSGLRSPVALRIGEINFAIFSGAAKTIARIGGSLSHSANA
jgi:hypothetical protein